MRYQSNDNDADDFGPEDHEDDKDAHIRALDAEQALVRANALRESLWRYSYDFKVVVSDDGRSAATCRSCFEIFVGDRENALQLAESLFSHHCLKREDIVYAT